MRSRRTFVIVVVAAAAVGAALTTVSYASAARTIEVPAARSASPSHTSTPTPTPTPTPSVSEELASFDEANQALIAKGGTLSGRAFIDNLVAAGFQRSAMQLTADTTTVGLKADNIEFSILIGSQCLIGQYGVVGYASTVQPELATHDCLIGSTKSINW